MMMMLLTWLFKQPSLESLSPIFHKTTNIITSLSTNTNIDHQSTREIYEITVNFEHIVISTKPTKQDKTYPLFDSKEHNQ